MFAKPWERSASAGKTENTAAAGKAALRDPPLPKVPPEILQAHKVKTNINNERILITPVKAQAFAKEMLVDFNPVKAMLRAGLLSAEQAEKRSATSLYKTAQRYEKNPYVQQALRDFVHRVESDKIVSRERILYGLLEEACFHGVGASASARVAAWSKLAKLMGMELPPEEANKTTNAPGGVMLIPFAPNIEQWEQAAVGQQAKLKADVRN